MGVSGPDGAQRADLGGVEICYRLAGEGPPALFIGGTGGDLRHPGGVLDGPLTASATVLAYDQRNLGRSSVIDRAVTMADYADDAARLVGHIGWRSCSVVGVSFGGMVAQELALRHAGIVERMVLCCTSSGGAGAASYPLHALADLDAGERARVMLGLMDIRHAAAWQDDHPAETEAMLAANAERSAIGADEPGREIGALRQLEARAGHDTWERLGMIAAPTLVCAGRYDAIAPVANAEALASRIPGAELEVFDGGHRFLAEDPRAWQAIAGWLQGRPG